jgi:uncharacterized cupin superfamily protein
MSKIEIRKVSEQELQDWNVNNWPTWSCDVSEFDWHYDDTEKCYFLEGHVIVTTDEGEVEIKAGDFVTFPAGLSCHWKVMQPVKKHYSFERTV